MPGFQFKFDSVLQQRRLAEENAQLAFAKTLRQRLILHDQLRNIQQTIRGSKQDLRDNLVGGVDVASIGTFARFASQATQRAQQIVVRLAGVEQQIESARQDLAEASRARKAIELLYDKHHERWLTEQRRREEAELDDVNNRIHATRVMQGAGV